MIAQLDLSGRGIQGRVEPYEGALQNPEEMKRAVLGELMNREAKAKLTWHSRKEAYAVYGKPLLNKGLVGPELDTNLPYILIEGRYYIQNCKVFLPNGQVVNPLSIAVEPIFDEKRNIVNQKQVEDANRLRNLVFGALNDLRHQAAERDPLLCDTCWEYTAENPKDYALHLLNRHSGASVADAPSVPSSSELSPPSSPMPDFNVTSNMLSNYTATPSTTVTTTTPIKVETDPAKLAPKVTPLTCLSCGKTCKTEAALKQHMTKMGCGK